MPSDSHNKNRFNPVHLKITLVSSDRKRKKTISLRAKAGETLLNVLIDELPKAGANVKEENSTLGTWISEIKMDDVHLKNIQIRNEEGKLPVIADENGNILWAGMHNMIISKNMHIMITDDSRANYKIDLPDAKQIIGGSCPSTPVNLNDINIQTDNII